ncbi:hypothetical protein [Nocardia gipuzkoensis]
MSGGELRTSLGHENATTTMQYYVRPVEDWDAVRKTMGDDSG